MSAEPTTQDWRWSEAIRLSNLDRARASEPGDVIAPADLASHVEAEAAQRDGGLREATPFEEAMEQAHRDAAALAAAPDARRWPSPDDEAAVEQLGHALHATTGDIHVANSVDRFDDGTAFTFEGKRAYARALLAALREREGADQ